MQLFNSFLGVTETTATYESCRGMQYNDIKTI